MKICKVLSISNHEKVQFIRVDIIIMTNKFLIFVEIPRISSKYKKTKNKIIWVCSKNILNYLHNTLKYFSKR